MNFLHNYTPNPILIDIGFLSIRWYGFFIVLGILISLFIVFKLSKKFTISSDEIYDLLFWLAISGLVGARLYEVVFINLNYYLENLSEIYKIWHGGLAIHGAIIGGVIALWLWIKKHDKQFWQLADLIAVVLPLAQSIGRWGNYFNQELFGLPTKIFIGIPIDISNRPEQFISYNYFHPTFLYESLLNLILFFVLFYFHRFKKLTTGSITMLYLVGYGVIRFSLEFIRIDPTPIYFGLKLPQIASLFLVLLVLVLWWARHKRLQVFDS